MAWLISTSDTLQINITQGESVRLFKYGKSDLDPSRDYVSITSSPEYANALPFHPESFTKQIDSQLKIKSDRRILELYEIAAVFNLGSFRSNDDSVLQLNKIFKGTDTYVHFVTQVDLQESLVAHEVVSNLKNVKTNAIFQITSTQTQVSIQLLYWLASLSESCYVYRPTVISDLYDIKYVILQNVKVPKVTSKGAIESLGIQVPDDFTKSIQCMNLALMKRKIQLYETIKDYLKTAVPKIEETEAQSNNAKKWMDTFLKPDKLLDKMLLTCQLKSVYDLDY